MEQIIKDIEAIRDALIEEKKRVLDAVKYEYVMTHESEWKEALETAEKREKVKDRLRNAVIRDKTVALTQDQINAIRLKKRLMETKNGKTEKE